MKAAIRRAINRLDRAAASITRRRVLFDARTPMNFAVLAPMFERLQRDPRVRVLFTSDGAAGDAGPFGTAGVAARIYPRDAMRWQRIDLCVNADPWDPIELKRCGRWANFFHGMAGKYDLDTPSQLPLDFGRYDRVGFINADRLRRYVSAGHVSPEAAVLVGFPKVDALANGRYNAVRVRETLQFDLHRPTAMYAPTWSPASSLHLAGEAIVDSLVAAGFNVIVKLHDRSLDRSNERFSGGIDWRARFAQARVAGRTAFVDAADSSPFLAASDVLITDHSSIGFESCLADRPIVVFDAPDLPRVARINAEKIAMLRRAACVVHTAADVGAAAAHELEHRDRLSAERSLVARTMFHEPGTATERAMAVVYDLLGMPAPGRRAALAAGAAVPARV